MKIIQKILFCSILGDWTVNAAGYLNKYNERNRNYEFDEITTTTSPFHKRVRRHHDIIATTFVPTTSWTQCHEMDSEMGFIKGLKIFFDEAIRRDVRTVTFPFVSGLISSFSIQESHTIKGHISLDGQREQLEEKNSLLLYSKKF